MNFSDLQIHLLKKERNIYEPAELFEQNRIPVKDLVNDLASIAEKGGELVLKENKLVCQKTQTEYFIKNDVVDFCKNEFEQKGDEWAKQNAAFLNYHKSLTVYTLLNSTPVLHYIGEKSGMADLKNAKVIDIGGGTGHAFCSLFRNPSTISYYLADPNLRLLHDQFLRVYPMLSKLKIGHVLSYAEKLPFKNEVADVVMSLSSIDHFKSYEDFMAEAHRVLKPGGTIFISSHLDVPASERIQKVRTSSKLFSFSFWERVSRYLYYRKYKVGSDDHTWHFETIEPIETGLKKNGFETIAKEEFNGFFWITAKKV